MATHAVVYLIITEIKKKHFAIIIRSIVIKKNLINEGHKEMSKYKKNSLLNKTICLIHLLTVSVHLIQFHSDPIVDKCVINILEYISNPRHLDTCDISVLQVFEI